MANVVDLTSNEPEVVDLTLPELEVLYIRDEDETQYEIYWVMGPGEHWEPTWEPKSIATQEHVKAWEDLKARRAKQPPTPPYMPPDTAARKALLDRRLRESKRIKLEEDIKPDPDEIKVKHEPDVPSQRPHPQPSPDHPAGCDNTEHVRVKIENGGAVESPAVAAPEDGHSTDENLPAVMVHDRRDQGTKAPVESADAQLKRLKMENELLKAQMEDLKTTVQCLKRKYKEEEE